MIISCLKPSQTKDFKIVMGSCYLSVMVILLLTKSSNPVSLWPYAFLFQLIQIFHVENSILLQFNLSKQLLRGCKLDCKDLLFSLRIHPGIPKEAASCRVHKLLQSRKKMESVCGCNKPGTPALTLPPAGCSRSCRDFPHSTRARRFLENIRCWPAVENADWLITMRSIDSQCFSAFIMTMMSQSFEYEKLTGA